MATLEVSVASGAEDGTENSAGTVSHVAATAISDATNEWIAFRFAVDGSVLAGSTITTAWLDFTITDANNDEPDHAIDCEDSATPAALTAGVANTDISGRTGTTATATLSSADLGSGSLSRLSTLESMPFPELKTIIQELVDSYGASITHVLVRMVGSADAFRDLGVSFYDADSAHAATLHIEYTTAGGILRQMLQHHGG